MRASRTDTQSQTNGPALERRTPHGVAYPTAACSLLRTASIVEAVCKDTATQETTTFSTFVSTKGLKSWSRSYRQQSLLCTVNAWLASRQLMSVGCYRGEDPQLSLCPALHGDDQWERFRNCVTIEEDIWSNRVVCFKCNTTASEARREVFVFVRFAQE